MPTASKIESQGHQAVDSVVAKGHGFEHLLQMFLFLHAAIVSALGMWRNPWCQFFASSVEFGV